MLLVNRNKSRLVIPHYLIAGPRNLKIPGGEVSFTIVWSKYKY
jgi:hypothetical protein